MFFGVLVTSHQVLGKLETPEILEELFNDSQALTFQPQDELNVSYRDVITNTILFSVVASPTEAEGGPTTTYSITYIPTRIPKREIVTPTATLLPEIQLDVKELPVYFHPGIVIGITLVLLLVIGWIYTSVCWKPKAVKIPQAAKKSAPKKKRHDYSSSSSSSSLSDLPPQRKKATRQRGHPPPRTQAAPMGRNRRSTNTKGAKTHKRGHV